jgi:hypothetical protein
MPIFFNSLLAQFGIAPSTVILLRHQDKRALPGRTPYELWRDNTPEFERYQSCQSVENRAKFSRGQNWASFVGTPGGDTMFVGLYTATYNRLIAEDRPQADRSGFQPLASRLIL